MTDTAPSTRAWVMLIIGFLTQMAVTMAITGPAFLIPHLHSDLGFNLTQAGTIATAPSFGLILTLIAWGAFADRFGERLAMTVGIGLTAIFSAVAVLAVGSPVWLTIVIAASGAAAASVNSASGRVVMGWFPKHRRGLAMGIRQMSQPLGTGLAAVTVPPIADAFGLVGYLWFLVIINGVMTIVCFAGVRNPPPILLRAANPAEPGTMGKTPILGDTAIMADSRAMEDAGAPEDSGTADEVNSGMVGRGRRAPIRGRGLSTSPNPYLSDSFLWRIHAVSALLVVPQFAFSTYGLIWLISNQQIDAGTAGIVVAISQVCGALGRMFVGGLSDRVGSRVAIVRIIAVLAVLLVVAVAAISLTSLPWAAALIFIAASVVSVADNGLAFASVAEAAGSTWSGKALGAQNTGQFAMSAALGPGLGALITVWGYPLSFALVAVAPLLSLGLMPKRDIERIT